MSSDEPIDFSQRVTAIAENYAGEADIDTNVIEYEFVVGFHKNHQLLYSKLEQQFYTKQHALKNYTLYRCREKTCKSKIHLKGDETCVKANNFVPHNHSGQADNYKTLKFRNDLVDAVTDFKANGDKDLNTIYRDISEE